MPRPMTSPPDALNGVESVAVPFAAPLTYNFSEPTLESKTPTRCTHTPAVGADEDSARMPEAFAVSLEGRENAQRLSIGSYSRSNAEFWTPSCDTAVCHAPPMAELFTHADTEKLCAVLSTGPAVAIVLLVPLKVAAPPDHVTLV